MAKVFVVTGPESSGKTKLSERLTSSTDGFLVEEYAREYLDERNGEYGYEDIERIARVQRSRIEESAKENDIIIADTGPLVLKVWSEYRFDNLSDFVREWWEKSDYYYLLCRPDLEWEFDPLRENPHNREELFSKYYLCLRSLKRDFVVIEGLEKQIGNWARMDKIKTIGVPQYCGLRSYPLNLPR